MVHSWNDISREISFNLLQAEGIQQPHKLFTGSWLKSSKSKNLGLSKQAFDGESGFVLVKLTKTKSTVQVSGTPSLKPEAEQAIRQIQVGNPDSVKEFTKEYGSHYIKDVVVGEMLYQVFALTPDQYANAKAAYYSAFSNPSISNGEFGSFYRTYLTPLNVRETGQIGVASGDIDVFRFTDKELSTTGQFGTHPNIFQLRENPALISPLESLTSGTSAIIGLNLASLSSWVPSAQAREYYDKIIDTQAALWEANL